MWPYIICFIFTLYLARKNERALKAYDAGCSTIGRVCMTGVPTIVLPAILAGCRDFRVGTDVTVYALNCFEKVKYARGFGGLFSKNADFLDSPIEMGYYILAYISHLFSDDPHVFLFFVSLFIGTFVYLTLFRMRRVCSMFLGQVVYLLCCYNETLNMMRQCMAMVMVLYALTFLLEDKNYVKCGLVMVASYFFHHSALIGVALLMTTVILTRDSIQGKSKSQMRWMIFFALLFSFVMANFFGLARMFISTNEIFDERYDHYLSDTSMKGTIGMRLTVYYFAAYFFLLLDRNKFKYGYVFLTFAILDIIFYYLRMQQVYLYRISDYFFYCRIIGLSSIPCYALQDKQKYKIVKYGLTLILSLFWLLYYGGESYMKGICTPTRMGGAHETMPYVSDVLDIK